ncbi:MULTISPECIES: hypothetical protein [Nguyenibacter]|uniref:Uncharacterized protein n=1 Tax=Nguyenibacter vanlangensis TaxID=1216886 RepID=A0ABZ3D0C8_9PROT|nr:MULTISPECIES: hypothetical protein [Nguyenibacter]WRH86857.1 hypothetical protein QN315_12710 [Nguyenibacter sp. L1]
MSEEAVFAMLKFRQRPYPLSAPMPRETSVTMHAYNSPEEIFLK